MDFQLFDLAFRGISYSVQLIINTGSSIIIEIEDKETTDTWRGSFSVQQIEEITHKTGNFKQFSIFVNMLKTAFMQTSEAVAVDLLTFTDLQSLRDRKLRNDPQPPPTTSPLNTKRYLILTYTVEFDRIHYPLTLAYEGKPDPRVLREEIRSLRAELDTLRSPNGASKLIKELATLRDEFDVLFREKEDVEAELLRLRKKLSTQATQLREEGSSKTRALKQMVRVLEEDLATERTRAQRAQTKHQLVERQLSDQLEEVRANERNLRIRLKSASSELAAYKRRPVGRSPLISAPPRSDPPLRRAAAVGASPASYVSHPSRGRSSSAERLHSRTNASHPGLATTRRPRSADRASNNSSTGSAGAGKRYDRFAYSGGAGRRSSLDRSRPRESPLRRAPFDLAAARPRPLRTPSPRYSAEKRFDPTAYVRDKQRRSAETSAKARRNIRRGIHLGTAGSRDPSPSFRGGPSSATRPPPPPSLRQSLRQPLADSTQRHHNRPGGKENRPGNGNSSTARRSYDAPARPARRTSSISSIASADDEYKFKRDKRPDTSLDDDGGESPAKPATQTLNRTDLFETSGTAGGGTSKAAYDRSRELNEIDSRLERLRQFMQSIPT